jgi:hypothetical protein
MKRGRGRPPLKAEERRSEPVGIRLTKAIRDQLEKARHSPEGDKTLGQEIELRLRQSFSLEEDIRERFGGRGTYWILQLIAEAIGLIEKNCLGDPPQGHWFDDPYTFDQVTSMIDAMLGYLKPRGKRTIPKHMQRPLLKQQQFGPSIAAYVLAGVEAEAKQYPSNPQSEVRLARERAVVTGAAIPLGRRLRKSALARNAKYWQAKQRRLDAIRIKQEKGK